MLTEHGWNRSHALEGCLGRGDIQVQEVVMSRNRSPLSLSSSDLGVTPVVIVGTGQIGTPLAAHLASLGA